MGLSLKETITIMDLYNSMDEKYPCDPQILSYLVEIQCPISCKAQALNDYRFNKEMETETILFVLERISELWERFFDL